MYEKRITNVIAKMKENGLTQIIVTDKMSIFYLTGCKINSVERIICLYINVDKTVKLIVNKLFLSSLKNIKSCECIVYLDGENPIQILGDIINKNEKIGVDKNWPSSHLINLSNYIKTFDFVNSSFVIDEIRQVKDEVEQEYMKESSRINDSTMEEVKNLLKEGVTEKQIADKILEIYSKLGADGVAFEPIVAFGKNTTEPHHEPDSTVLKQGDCIVIDIGCVKNDYLSDMTRTFVCGKPREEQEKIYEIVKEANLRGIKAAKVGARMCDVDFAARSYIEEQGYGQYFIHSTGHSIGLEVHEVGSASRSNETVIKEGQIFSVEPGIYIPELEIGVRIEDLVLITKDGLELLNSYTKELLTV